MKKVFSIGVAGCLLSLVLVGSAGAQEPGTAIRVSVPFDFVVKGKTLFTAGEQTGEELNPSHKERELKREMARNQSAPETVTVAALN